ncbi:MAG: 4-hydroxy-tetrahydrodipicolinate synthase [Chitinophagaceae bacterium]|nr:4-hydroxy-tetrahydrodipicolinate synthase [Chitinophagaceae bacterium]MCA6453221.1 4-hydroxy-tetrahydrodipicolinate synthase [Chitinophagaceae bacterium]MCA6459752.1 4-hydroxy-tetrahydrodipicolinate synthase [Chitinophagaceae bacterium]MCA6466285.1 4-hydroxy-tetrahydrodipicolinate synthase [Chitinophagaceae bacterium]
MSLRQQLQGTGVALVTPFTSDLKVDFDSLGNVIDTMIKGGVEYLITLGTTGETPTLDKQEKLDIVNYTFEKVAGRVPVVVGIGGNNTAELINDLHKFPLDKAVAVLSASPNYNKPSQEGIYQHYKALAAASPKPILLYNVPGRTGRNMTAETTLRLAQLPNIAGMKEASGDMAQCMQLLRDMPEDFLLVSGDDGLALPLIACGMHGVISVAANAFPAEFSEMIRLCLKHDFAAAKPINDKLIEAYDLMFAENNPAGVKAFMAEKGWIGNHLRLPVVPLSEGLHSKVRNYLKK